MNQDGRNIHDYENYHNPNYDGLEILGNPSNNPSNNNNNNNNNIDNNAPRILHRRLPLEDEEEWLRRNGLRSAEEHDDDEPVRFHVPVAQVQAEREYQQQRLNEYFRNDDQQQQQEHEQKQRILLSWKGQIVRVVVVAEHRHDDCLEDTKREEKDNSQRSHHDTTAASVVLDFPLDMIAAHSDTIFVMARSRHLYNADSDGNRGNDNIDTGNDNIPPASSDILTISLIEYDPQAVRNFLNVLVAPEYNNSSNHNNNIANYISSEDWIEACHVAHFLQCHTQLQQLADRLRQQIDATNCMHLVQLADQLSLHGLFEASLQFMLTQVGDMERSQWWAELSSVELRESLQTMTQLLQNSLLHNGSAPTTSNNKNGRRTHLFFSTLDEYLAIFAEQVEYYQDRLEEARRSQALLREQMVNRGRHGHTTHAWQYAQDKIVQQETRVRTLKTALKEQKQLFGRVTRK